LAENLTNAATGTRDRRRFGIIEIRYRTAGRVGRRSEVQRAVVGLRRVNLTPDHLTRSGAAGRSSRFSAPCSSIWPSGPRPRCLHSTRPTVAGEAPNHDGKALRAPPNPAPRPQSR
jgi:hypothetical protein